MIVSYDHRNAYYHCDYGSGACRGCGGDGEHGGEGKCTRGDRRVRSELVHEHVSEYYK